MEDKNIIISNEKELKEKIKEIKKQGKEKFHVIADFDRTLTKGSLNGDVKITSIINRIAMGGYLNPDYSKKSSELYDKYYAIEKDPKIPIKEKTKEMENWWREHNQLLVKSGLSLEVMKKVVKKEDPYFRNKVSDFFDLLNKNQIPLIILSSSRGEMIKLFLEKYNFMKNNTHIIANRFEFDKNGKVIGYEEPVIHLLNKSEASIKELPIYDDLLKRKNVLLLGDSLGDLGMIEGFPYENLITLGFLNENINENLESYKKAYDIVVLNDGSMDYVNGLLKKIIS